MFGVKIAASKFYFNCKKKLPVGELIKSIAMKEVINKNILRNFEKVMCKLAGLKLDLKYFRKLMDAAKFHCL